MLNVVRRAFEECTGSYDREAFTVPVTAGPLYLLSNALAITAFTYVLSLRLVNVERAAKEYDARVPKIHARAAGSAGGCCSSSKLHRVVAACIFLGMHATLIYTSMTLEKASSRFIFSTWVKMTCSFVASMGFFVLYRLSTRPSPESFFTRFVMRRRSVRVVATWNHPRTTADRVVALSLIAAGIYAVVYPNGLMTSLAMVGFGLGAAARPQGLARTLSIRGIVIATTAYSLSVVVAAAFAVSMTWSNTKDESSPVDYDVDSIMDRSWRAAPVQFQGVFVGALLTAMVLRYEYQASDPTGTLSTSVDAEKAPLINSADKDGKTPSTAIFSPKEAFEARVAIPSDRPQFAKPLFYTLLAGLFVVHIPAIVLSTRFIPVEQSVVVYDSVAHPVLDLTARLVLALPAQIWTVFLLPALVGVACLVRKDGAALWKYHEVLSKPLEPAPVETETATDAGANAVNGEDGKKEEIPNLV